MKCPECEHQWSSERPVNLENMIQVYSREQAHKIKDVPTLMEMFHSCRRKAYNSNSAPPYAEHLFREKCGRRHQANWCRNSIFGSNPTNIDKQNFFEYLEPHAKRYGSNPLDWIMREFEKEFGPGTWEQFAQMMSKRQSDRR